MDLGEPVELRCAATGSIAVLAATEVPGRLPLRAADYDTAPPGPRDSQLTVDADYSDDLSAKAAQLPFAKPDTRPPDFSSSSCAAVIAVRVGFCELLRSENLL